MPAYMRQRRRPSDKNWACASAAATERCTQTNPIADRRQQKVLQINLRTPDAMEHVEDSTPTPSPVSAPDLVQISTTRGDRFWIVRSSSAGEPIELTKDNRQCLSFFRAVYTGDVITPTEDGEATERLFHLQHPTVDNLYVGIAPLALVVGMENAAEFYAAESSQFLQYSSTDSPHAFCATTKYSVTPTDMPVSQLGVQCNSLHVMRVSVVPSGNFALCRIGSSKFMSNTKVITSSVLFPLAGVLLAVGIVLMYRAAQTQSLPRNASA